MKEASNNTLNDVMGVVHQLQLPQDKTPRIGCYFLFKQNNLLYIGKSINIAARVFTHLYTKDFDACYFLECSKERLSETETALIRLFQPILNWPKRRKYFALPDSTWFLELQKKKQVTEKKKFTRQWNKWWDGLSQEERHQELQKAINKFPNLYLVHP